MIATKVSALESLQLEAIQGLVRSPGPCVTLLLPAYRPGEQAQSMAGVIKSNLKVAARQLMDGKIPASIRADLLDPLEDLTWDPALLKGSHWGRVIFRSQELFRQSELIEPISTAVVVAGCFQVRPILAELHLPAEFYLLKLTKKRVELLRCAALHAQPVKLPKGVPETLEEAMAFKQPDHDLENRSPAGGSIGSMRGVRFGTGSGRETQQTHLADFYKLVDHGLHTLFSNGRAPLVLAGVEEDTALYGAVNRYPNLLKQSIHGGSGGALAEYDLLRQAYAIVRSDCIGQAAKALLESKERFAPARYSTDLNIVLQAALDGRVSSLFIDEFAKRSGVFQGPKRRGPWSWGEEDLLNAAAVETILHGGKAFALPASKMPDRAVVAAILRF